MLRIPPSGVPFVVAALALGGVVHAQNWPSFRGANAAGVGEGTPSVNWDVAAGRNVRWKLAIPGLAHSSPIVWGDRVYLTTAVASAGRPTVRTGDSDRAGIGAADDIVSHTWHVLAIDKNTGRVTWDRAAFTGTPRVKRHVKASHASATPATNGRVIVAMLGSEGLFCFDMNGTLKWRQDLGPLAVGLADDPTYEWGPASSPVIDGARVFVQNDRYKDSYVAAYDLDTGKQVWRQTRDELPSWATPLVARTGARTEIITNGARFFRSYDAETGRELWRLPDAGTEVKVPTPVAAGDLFILTGGYPSGGRPISAVKQGDPATHLRAAGHKSHARDLHGHPRDFRRPPGDPHAGEPLRHRGALNFVTPFLHCLRNVETSSAGCR